MGHFCTVVHNPSANWNRGGHGPKEGRGDHAVDEKEDSRQDGREDSDWPLAGNDSGASGTSLNNDDESLMEVAEGKSEEKEDSRGGRQWNSAAGDATIGRHEHG